MNRRKFLGFVALLTVLLVAPLVWSFGLAGVPEFSMFSAPTQVESASSSANVFVDPGTIIKDYLLDPGYQIGDKFMVHVNISDVTDLFSWQINMSWDPSVLNVSNIVAGEFLLRTVSASKTAAFQLGFVINATDNSKGYTGMGESILGGASGISGNGTLVSIEFLVVGYGCTDLTISLTGNLATTLLNSTILPDGQPGIISFTKTDGYFRNKLQGDATGDGSVDIVDISKVIYHRSGPPPGPGGYDRNVDINDDGAINVLEISLVIANRDRSI